MSKAVQAASEGKPQKKRIFLGQKALLPEVHVIMIKEKRTRIVMFEANTKGAV